MLNALLATFAVVVVSVVCAIDSPNSFSKDVQPVEIVDELIEPQFIKRSFNAHLEPLNLYKRYYALDTLGGLGLGKRAAENIPPVNRLGLIDDSRYKKAFTSLDSLGGMGLGKRSVKLPDSKRESSFNYFDSLGGTGLGK